MNSCEFVDIKGNRPLLGDERFNFDYGKYDSYLDDGEEWEVHCGRSEYYICIQNLRVEYSIGIITADEYNASAQKLVNIYRKYLSKREIREGELLV